MEKGYKMSRDGMKSILPHPSSYSFILINKGESERSLPPSTMSRSTTLSGFWFYIFFPSFLALDVRESLPQDEQITMTPYLKNHTWEGRPKFESRNIHK